MISIAALKKAFTLAEVLLVVGIIGIVAELTIPMVVANVQKDVYVTKLKKFYTTFEQGNRTILTNNGCDNLECVGLFGEPTLTNFIPRIDTAYKGVFKIIESNTNKHEKNLKTLAGNVYGWKNFGPTERHYVYLTADGVLVVMTGGSGGGNLCKTSASNASKYSKLCSWLIIDVNGDKGPNQYGRDVHSA